jgi:hypothetical protein
MARRPVKRVSDFRARQLAGERQRMDLLARLDRLPSRAHEMPAYANVRKLLGTPFGRATVSRRLAVLQSAEWLLNVLESSLPFI